MSLKPFKFSACQVSKDTGLDIIRGLSKKLEETKARRRNNKDINPVSPPKGASLGMVHSYSKGFGDKYCLHSEMPRWNDPDESMAFTHELAIAIIDLTGDDYASDFDYELPLSHYYDDILDGQQDCNCQRSTRMELYRCRISVDNGEDKILIKAHLFDEYETDVSYTTYSYDTTLKCWVEEEGVNDHGHVVILDFSGYALDDDCPKP